MKHNLFNPMVSVIIPTYNRSKMLDEAISSVLRQTYTNFELIVVDDGSNDDTEYSVKKWIGVIRYIRREFNEGRSAAVNYGVKNANGEYIAILDSDDVWLPHKLDAQMKIFSQFPECGAVGGGAMYIDIKCNLFGKPMIPSEVISYEKMAISICLPGSHSNEIVRRDAYESVGGLDISLRRAQDYDFWLKFIRRYPIRAVPEVLMYKRAHASQRIHADINTIITCRKKIASRIPETDLRRKHMAWMWFMMACKSFHNGFRAKGLEFLVRSFFAYPLSISSAHSRLKGVYWYFQEKYIEKN